MSEEEAFESLFHAYCENAGFIILQGYPLYEITDGLSKLRVRIINPFIEAEIEDIRKIKNATPKKILETAKLEFTRKKGKRKKEDDVIRFSKILLYSAQQILLLVDSPLEILKIKTLLGLTKHLYSIMKIDVDELEMFNTALNSNLLEFELFPGREAANSVELMYPLGDKRKYSLIRFKRYGLASSHERKPKASI